VRTRAERTEGAASGVRMKAGRRGEAARSGALRPSAAVPHVLDEPPAPGVERIEAAVGHLV